MYSFLFMIVLFTCVFCFFFFSSRRRHTRYIGDWSSDVCSSDLTERLVGWDGRVGSGSRYCLRVKAARRRCRNACLPLLDFSGSCDCPPSLDPSALEPDPLHSR